MACLEAHGFLGPDTVRASVCCIPDAEASAYRRRQWVRIAADGVAYRLALAGDPLFLAGVLLHDAAHLDGAGEATAFALERAFLRLANASPDLIAHVDDIEAAQRGPAPESEWS